ncbi:MAG TPA: HEAT repeat domain-containing protein [Streptosporangiaceae bacterium]
MQGSGPVDAAIAGYLRRQDAESAAVLAATGDAGARRLVSLAFGEQSEPFSNPIPDVDSRVAIDRWTAALSVVAAASPVAFMDAIDDRQLNTALLSILGVIDDPRATAILCQHIADQDWLRRCNAVSALGRRNDPASRPCIERALSDPHLVVRAEAIKAVSRWDADRAVVLYEELLHADRLTPLLRAEARAAVSDLRAGFPVRDPWDRQPPRP